MNLTLTIAQISLAFNSLFLLMAVIFIAKRGGLSYLVRRFSLLKAGDPAEFLLTPFYQHRLSQFTSLSIDSSDIVFLGDSITNEGEWSEWFGNSRVKNRGISADTTIGLLNRLDGVLQGNPRQIFLMIGINNLLNNRQSVDEVTQSYKNILIKIKQHHPNAAVCIQSVLPVNCQFFDRQINHEIAALNTQLQVLAQEFSYPYIDLFSQFLDDRQQLDDRYSLDGLHLNGQGYQLWKRTIAPFVAEIS